MTSDQAANDAPAAGAGKAEGFALKVRLGERLAEVQRLQLDIGVTRARVVEVLADIDRLQVAAMAIADALAKDRG